MHRLIGPGPVQLQSWLLSVHRQEPYTQTWLASRDADRLNAELEGRAALVIPGFTVMAKDAVFRVSDHDSYADPHGADVTALIAAAIAGVSARPLQRHPAAQVTADSLLNPDEDAPATWSV